MVNYLVGETASLILSGPVPLAMPILVEEFLSLHLSITDILAAFPEAQRSSTAEDIDIGFMGSTI